MKFIFSIISCFFLSYMLNSIIIRVSKIDYISQINLDVFTLILSCLVTVSIATALSANNDKLRYFNIEISYKVYFLTIILGVFFLSIYIIVSHILYSENGRIIFQAWNEIPSIQIFIAIVVCANLLYVPSYILNKTILTQLKLTFLEKCVFYPALSGLILALLGVADLYLKTEIFSSSLIILLLNSLLIVLLIYNYKYDKLQKSAYVGISINLLEIFGIISAMMFNAFIFYSAIGECNAFLRGDMWADAHRIAFLAKYGINGYLASPVEGYPPFYSFFWLVLTRSLPIPFINGLLIIAFFNHLFSILALYIFAKILLKNSRSALLAVILWTTLSGFSWTYLIINPPLNLLSGNELLNYVSQISRHFGIYSGSIVSPIYADGHALTRLWSLGLLFASMSALIKGHHSVDSKGEIVIFSSCFIQILLGHIAEIPLLSLSLLALFLLGKPSPAFVKRTFLATTVSSSICVATLMLLYRLNFIFIFISFMPILMIIFAKLLSVSYSALGRKYICQRSRLTKISQGIKSVLAILFLYIYGLMWIAIASKFPMRINYPIATLWYSPAIEWGFLGLLAIIALTKLGLSEKKWPFGLKFIVLLFFLQLALLAVLNYFNYNFFYITTPYPFQPVLFLPILALITSYAFPTIRFDNNLLHKIKLSFIALLIIMLFSLGSLDHISSASYWKANNGWWLNKPLNPSYEDIQLINFLYGHPSASLYEFVGTFYDWANPSSYVVYPSGMAVLSQPLIDILWQANDSREVSLLTNILPVNYILIPKGQPLQSLGWNISSSYLLRKINTSTPIFENGKYKLYSINQLNLPKVNLLSSSKEFLTATRIAFKGDLILEDELNGKIYLTNTSGEICPLDEGKVIIHLNSSINNVGNNIIALTPSINIKGNVTLNDMKSTWRYFYEIRCSAEKLIISGKVSFKVFNSFTNIIYMESFTYSGKYIALPFPSYLRPDYAKEQIKDYLRDNNVDPLSVITSVYGILWHFTIIVLLLKLLSVKIKVRIVLQQTRH